MKSDNTNPFDFARELDFQQILTNPILDIAARFWEDDRYEAFKICYRSMRVVDDLIDDRKATGDEISAHEKTQYAALVNDWVEAIHATTAQEQLQRLLIETIVRFNIPRWPWQRLARSMVYDLHHDGFASYRVFLRYAKGAAVAPASIFMHLCGISSTSDGYRPPEFNVRKASRPLALFSYLVHIIRDFEKDQKSNLSYFADNLLAAHGLNRAIMRQVADGGDIPAGFRALMHQYRDFAAYYRGRARLMIDSVFPVLQPRYRLSLEIIYSLYSQIFERIDPDKGRFTTVELNPSPEEIQKRINATIAAFRSNI
ncbi:MAG: squalene/phytoene synthase family protein [candidate division Zixibacteria bacterium]|nr:squalene/phytoene synthase family protein [candidate division Zixibacteria bacterium]